MSISNSKPSLKNLQKSYNEYESWPWKRSDEYCEGDDGKNW